MSDIPTLPSQNHSAASASTDIAKLQASIDLQQATLDALPMMLTVFEVVSATEFRIALVNRAGDAFTPDIVDVIGKQLKEMMLPTEAARVEQEFQRCLDADAPRYVEASYQIEHDLRWTYSSYIPIRALDGHISHILTIWEDITERKQREQTERAQQETIITHQAATLAELSTPLLAISDTTVVMPLIGTVDTRRIQHIMDALLAGVAERRATHVILDITGVAIIDTQVANAFLRASQAVNLLGAQVIITGIRLEVAQTLVSLGVDLSSIITRSSLQNGIAYAMQGETRHV